MFPIILSLHLENPDIECLYHEKFLQPTCTVLVADAPRVVLKRGKTAVFRNGHPMVYSGAVDRVIGKPQPQAGDCVLVTDSTEVPIGWGVFNPASWFRVRCDPYMLELCSASRVHQLKATSNLPHRPVLHVTAILPPGLGSGMAHTC